MYDLSKFVVCDEVKIFQNDCDLLIKDKDASEWLVDKEWSERFRTHLNILEPLAKLGDAWAQYSISVIYMLGYLYLDEDEMAQHYEKDVATLSYWLEKAAKQGFITAVDNLISTGVGPEADRLRKIFTEVEKELGTPFNEELNLPVYGPEYCEKVWEIAYGNLN